MVKHSALVISPPLGTRKTYKKRKGGMIPLAIAAPILAGLAGPTAALAGREIARGVEAGVKKIRKMLGIGGIIRPGMTRKLGGKKKKAPKRTRVIRF